MAARIIGLIATTFLIAVIYGVGLTTLDFMAPNYDPVASGHHAAKNVYGLFGTVSDEIQKNEADPTTHTTSVSHKIAVPYAVTADLSAILGGKLEIKLFSLFHSAETHAQI